MKSIILVCAVCLYLGESYGSENQDGVGAFAYDGPSGRYGGTYGLKDGQVVNQQGNLPPNFTPPTFPDLDDFFPEYFSNLENILQETFDNVEHQKLAYAAATKAFDLTSNRAGSNQYIAPSRFPFGGNFPGFDGFPGPGFQGPGFQGPGFQGAGFPGYGFPGHGFPGLDMPNYRRSSNSAFAGAAIGPDFTHQVADINPANPNMPNVNKLSSVGSKPGGYHSVSSSSYTSSTNINGQKSNTRRAETVVDNNGAITRYMVEN